MKAQIISFDEADKRLKKALSSRFLGGYDKVLLVDGSLTTPGDFLPAIKKLARGKFDIVAITGSLTVKGRLALYDVRPGLYVGGTTRALTIEGGDCEVYLRGGEAKYFVYGDGSDGVLDAGKVKTPWIINYGHDLEVTPVGKAFTVDNHRRDDSCDFHAENIASAFVPGALDADKRGVDVDKLFKLLAAGKPVLQPNARTIRQLRKQQVAEKTKGAKAETRTVSVDLTNKKLGSFPKSLLKMPWLERLVLDKNKLGKLPADIDKLKNLKELSLAYTTVGALPESLAKLEHLRFLSLEGATFSLPKSFGKCKKLETLVLSSLCSGVVNDEEHMVTFTPWPIPESVGAVKSLKRIVGAKASLAAPKSMKGHPGIEEVVITGGSDRYIKVFPEWVCDLPNLKRLDLSENYFPTFPAAFTKLKNLEELYLDGALGRVTALPDLSKLPKLRVLGFSGGCSTTRVPEPPHALLKELLAMRLDALETLHIDRWGEEDEHRKALPPALLAPLARLRKLRRLDLSFNDLKTLPDELFTLEGLEHIDLQNNELSAKVVARVRKTWPSAIIDLRGNPGAEAKGNALDDQIDQAERHIYFKRFDDALAGYASVMKQLPASDRARRARIHAGKMRVLSSMAADDKLAAAKREAWSKQATAEAEAFLEVLPDTWKSTHLTDDVAGMRELVCNVTNHLAWKTYLDASASPEALARAVAAIEKGASCAFEYDHAPVLDTQARLLLRIGREEDAWRAVARGLAIREDLPSLNELRRDPRYEAWSARPS